MKIKKLSSAGIKWFQEARYGMFVHFGLYSLLGENENQIRNKFPDKQKYAELMHKFTIPHFNAKEWVDCAKSMGAHYLVPTVRHAEGFCLWDSKLTKFKSTNTPCKRDLIAELASACENSGVQLSFYFNLETWLNDGNDVWNEMGMSYAEYIEGQLSELLTNYGPVGLIWFDHSSEEIPYSRLKKIHKLIKSLQSNCLVNERGKKKTDPSIGDFITLERNLAESDRNRNLVIEECDAMGVRSWGYDKSGAFWSVPELARRVSICASKGYNYLLNVEPAPDGRIRSECRERAEELGKWISANEVALSAKCSTIVPLDPNIFSRPEIGVCTVAGSTLYVHLHQWPVSDELFLPVKGKVVSKRLLSKLTDDGIVLGEFPAVPPAGSSPWIIAVEFSAAPIDINKIETKVQEPDSRGAFFLSPENATRASANGVLLQRLNRFPDGRISMGSLHMVGDQLIWNVKVAKKMTCLVDMSLGTMSCQEDSTYELSGGIDKIEGAVWPTGHYSKDERQEIGTLRLEKGDNRITLTIKSVKNDSGSFSDVYGIWLSPV